MEKLLVEQTTPISKQTTFEGSVQEAACRRLPAEVSQWVKLRAKAGYEKYGTYLFPNNGRDWLRDVAEELLDAAVYAECGILEGDAQAVQILEALLPLVSKVATDFLSKEGLT